MVRQVGVKKLNLYNVFMLNVLTDIFTFRGKRRIKRKRDQYFEDHNKSTICTSKGYHAHAKQEPIK